MIGIIYKFTIIAKVKYNGNKPFYVGQHFGLEDFESYYGSGKIWNKFINHLKQYNPNNWRCFIKREILYSSDKITQRGLDAMEAYYIKREKAHYSYGIGGCNVLWGTANNFGSGSPMKDAGVKERVVSKLRGRKGAKRSMQGRKNMSIAAKKSWINADKRRRALSEYVSFRMKNGGAEYLSNKRKGIKFSDETRRKMSKNHADFSGNKHPLWGSKFIWITNGVVNKRHNPDMIVPDGYYKGVKHKNKIFNHEHNF